MDEIQARMIKIQEKRRQLAVAREHAHARSRYGASLVLTLAEVTRLPVSLNDFDVSETVAFDWPTDLADAPGLVETYVGKARIAELLACVSHKIGTPDGRIGFHGADYLGFAAVQGVELTRLLDLAETTEESVLFGAVSPAGSILVDCYHCQTYEPFSLVVQGDELVQALAPCFPKRNAP